MTTYTPAIIKLVPRSDFNSTFSPKSSQPKKRAAIGIMKLEEERTVASYSLNRKIHMVKAKLEAPTEAYKTIGMYAPESGK